jgi:hypothetical protein
MKKTIIALAALSLALTACDSPEEVALTSTTVGVPEIEEVPLYPTREPDDTLSAEERAELAFMTVLQGFGIDEFYIADMIDERIPQDICNAFDSGATLAEVGLVVYANSPLDFEQSGAVVGASVGGWCPEHDGQI